MATVAMAAAVAGHLLGDGVVKKVLVQILRHNERGKESTAKVGVEVAAVVGGTAAGVPTVVRRVPEPTVVLLPQMPEAQEHSGHGGNYILCRSVTS